MRKPSQTDLIRQSLLDGNQLTPLDALDQFGCFRLAARISELRQEGLDIRTSDVTRNGKRHALYWLPQNAFLPSEC